MQPSAATGGWGEGKKNKETRNKYKYGSWTGTYMALFCSHWPLKRLNTTNLIHPVMHPDKHFNLIFTHTTQMQYRVIFLNYHTEMTWYQSADLIFFCAAKYVDFENSQS